MKFGIERLQNIIKRFSIGKLFYNNKFVLVFSLVTSFIIWIAISSNDSKGHPVTISDIPIAIDLSESATQDGLKIFSGQDTTASVQVRGNRLIVGQLNKNDIKITAQQAATTIMSPGNYTLELTAKKNSMLNDYEFVSTVQPAFITVTVDRYREAEFNIEPNINFTANSEYFVGSTVLSTTNVRISGPESEVSKIKKVVAEGTIAEELQDSKTIKANLVFYDAYGEPISGEAISSTVSEVDATIPVLVRKNLPVEVDFTNKPEDLKISNNMITIKPNTLEIAGPKSAMEELESVHLSPIDFNSINLENNSFELAVNLPKGCRSLNNLYTVNVELNMNSFKEKNLWVTQFSLVNAPEGKETNIYTDGIMVRCVGPASRITNLKANNISGIIDMEGKESTTGYLEIPVKLNIDSKEIWVYGSYSVNVGIT